MVKIAVASENEMVTRHFGHCTCIPALVADKAVC